MLSFAAFEERISEDDCLDEITRMRFGREPCKACGGRGGFALTTKHRAAACRDCGFVVFPCVGTPFARPQPPLRHWFFAIYRASRPDRFSGRVLKVELGMPARAADALAAEVLALKRDDGSAVGDLDWFHLVEVFVEDRLDAPATNPSAGHPSSPATLDPSATRKPTGARRGLDRWTYVGVGGIVGLALAAAGLGWLLVPSVPDEDQELVQATAILTLANDKPVILVTAEVAQQLYDVSDIEADPSAPPVPSIRLAPPPGSAGPAEVAASKPLSQPAIRLAPSVGQSLLRGDLAAVRSAGRPELAAYAQLAQELEAKGPRNPDELLTFGPMKIRRHLVEKVFKAAVATKMDPILLMAIADKESSFVTEIQAQTSSATGLFQFIERTWLGVVRDFGAAFGLGAEAALVASGSVPAPDRTRILDLRRDAYLSAVFAAQMLTRDSDRIGRRLGRGLTGGEVYLVHFLGPDGAEKLLAQAAAAPTAAASDLLPRAAEANKAIFYGTSPEGSAKQLSVTEVKDKIETMITTRTQRYQNLKAVTLGGSAPASGRK